VLVPTFRFWYQDTVIHFAPSSRLSSSRSVAADRKLICYVQQALTPTPTLIAILLNVVIPLFLIHHTEIVATLDDRVQATHLGVPRLNNLSSMNVNLIRGLAGTTEFERTDKNT
jgi:hypothetical protein